jgi:tetratricopeptide (TPR) repeat protein
LQLARLARKKGETKEAEDYYRASIFGSWEQDGAARRREVRLELVDFLIGQRQFAEARNELFTVAGNAPGDAGLNVLVGDKLEAANDASDALSFYEKAIAASPRNEGALERAGRLAYALGEYAKAEELLGRAFRLSEDETVAKEGHRVEDDVELRKLMDDARRIQELTLTRDQAAGLRADHLLLASRVAQARLKSCGTQAGASLEGAGMVAALNAEWKTATGNGRINRPALLQSADAQDAWTQLVYQTEQETAKVCGAPTGDDALLLRLAKGATGMNGTNGANGWLHGGKGLGGDGQ